MIMTGRNGLGGTIIDLILEYPDLSNTSPYSYHSNWTTKKILKFWSSETNFDKNSLTSLFKSVINKEYERYVTEYAKSVVERYTSLKFDEIYKDEMNKISIKLKDTGDLMQFSLRYLPQISSILETDYGLVNLTLSESDISVKFKFEFD